MKIFQYLKALNNWLHSIDELNYRRRISPSGGGRGRSLEKF